MIGVFSSLLLHTGYSTGLQLLSFQEPFTLFWGASSYYGALKYASVNVAPEIPSMLKGQVNYLWCRRDVHVQSVFKGLFTVSWEHLLGFDSFCQRSSYVKSSPQHSCNSFLLSVHVSVILVCVWLRGIFLKDAIPPLSAIKGRFPIVCTILLLWR